MNAAEQVVVVIELAAEPLVGMIPKARQVYLSKIVAWAKAHPDWKGDPATAPEPMKPMGDAEARMFEAVVMPYGAHKGVSIGEVPISYFDYVFDPSEFTKKLKRYYNSDHAARRRELETR